MKRCECGCGDPVNEGSRFLRGHNPTKPGLSVRHIRGPINRKRSRRVKLDPWLVEIGLTMDQLDEFRAEQKRSALASLA